MAFTTTGLASPVPIAPSNTVTHSRQKGLSFIASKSINCLILKLGSLRINTDQASSRPTESWNFSINSEVDFASGAQPWKKALRTAAASTSDAEGDKIVQHLAKSSRQRLSRKERNPKCLSSSSAAQKVVLDPFQIVKYPLITDLTMREMIKNNTSTFVVDNRADKSSIKAAVKKMFKIQTKKVNTLIMPNGNKKAYIILTPNHNAVEVAKKIKII